MSYFNDGNVFSSWQSLLGHVPLLDKNHGPIWRPEKVWHGQLVGGFNPYENY